MDGSPLDLGAVKRLWHGGVLPAGRYGEAAAAVRDDAHWRLWAERVLLALAVAHLLAAVLFFFAFNWQDLPRLAKLAVLGAAVAAAALASRAPLPAAAAEACLVAAMALVGVLLAVFGQVYQTGADAWQLFAAWAALVLPWALAARTAAAWAVWGVVAQVGLYLYLDGQPWWRQLAAVAAVPALLLAVREALLTRVEWLRPGWTRLVPLGVALAPALLGAVIGLFDDEPPAIIAFGVLATAAVAGFKPWRRDFAALSIAVAAVCGFLAAAAIRLIHTDSVAGFLFDGLVTLGVFSGGWGLLRHWQGGRDD